jgi:hypothetical protein
MRFPRYKLSRDHEQNLADPPRRRSPGVLRADPPAGQRLRRPRRLVAGADPGRYRPPSLRGRHQGGAHPRSPRHVRHLGPRRRGRALPGRRRRLPGARGPRHDLGEAAGGALQIQGLLRPDGPLLLLAHPVGGPGPPLRLGPLRQHAYDPGQRQRAPGAPRGRRRRPGPRPRAAGERETGGRLLLEQLAQEIQIGRKIYR